MSDELTQHMQEIGEYDDSANLRGVIEKLRATNRKLVEHLRSFGKLCDDFGWHNLADEVRAVIEENDDGE